MGAAAAVRQRRRPRLDPRRGRAGAEVQPGRAPRRATRGVRPRRAVHPARRRPAVRPADRGAARALEHDRPGEDRPERAGPRQPLRVPPRLPGQRAQPGLRLRALAGPPRHGRRDADGLRARRDRPRTSGEARAPVLVLLRLQRLQQHARRRLGDDPARLRRGRRRRGVEHGADRDRLQLARGRREGGLGRREARARRRDAPRRLPSRREPREQVRRRPLPRQLGGRRGGLRRHPRAARRAPARREDDSERPGSGREGVSVDHVRGALGRAAAGVLQRPDRAEPQGRSGPSRSRGPTAGAHEATRSRPAGSSARARRTSSAAGSRRAPQP